MKPILREGLFPHTCQACAAPRPPRELLSCLPSPASPLCRTLLSPARDIRAMGGSGGNGCGGQRDSAAQAKAGLAWALQRLGRDGFCSLICWAAASPAISSSLQAARRLLCPILHHPPRLQGQYDLPEEEKDTGLNLTQSGGDGDAGRGCCGEGTEGQGVGTVHGQNSVLSVRALHPFPDGCCDHQR